MVKNFGSYLKHERELRGVTLEVISETTKIHIKFLQALEENNFEELPGEVFIRGYIKSYANTIGSDPEETLNVYDEFVGNKVPIKNLDSVDQSNISAIKFLAYALIGLLILVLVFSTKFLFSLQARLAGNFFNHSISAPEKIIEKEKFQKTKKNLEAKKILQKNIVPLKNTEKKESVDLVREQETRKLKDEIQQQKNRFSSTRYKNSKDLNKFLKLSIKVKNDSWFNLTIDNFRKEDFILQAGKEQSFVGNEKFRLTIGNKKGTELILNGTNLVIPEGKENVVKDFIITSKLID